MSVSKLVVVVLAAGAAVFSLPASADAAAGKAKFTATCAECHEAGDFEGESAKALGDSLKKMAGGQMKHKTAIKLTDAEIADVAAYLATGGK